MKNTAYLANSFRYLFATLATFIFFQCAMAQVINPGMMEDTSQGERIGKIYLEGYLDTYVGYYMGHTVENEIPVFVNHNRNREFNVNLAYLNLRYKGDRIRAKLIPGFGTYMNANYPQKGTLGHLVEANVGYKLSENKEIWLDMGVLASPYTNESPISRDQLMYTRSLSAEMVPYYLTGAKLGLPMGAKWNLYLYALNGWQNILDNNRGKALGTQVEFRPNAKSLWNWNTFFGEESDGTGPMEKWRFLSDLYWVFNPGEKWSFTSCWYVGAENQKYSTNSSWGFWSQANFIGRYRFSKIHSLSGRLEYFFDPDGVIARLPGSFGSPTLFSVGSTGLCWNMQLTSNALFRMEGRQFFAPDKTLLTEKHRNTRFNSWLICGAAVSF